MRLQAPQCGQNKVPKSVRFWGLLVWLCLGLFGNGFAQRDWNWVFGDSVWMQFPEGGEPIVRETNFAVNSHEMGGSFSNHEGRLLFYFNHQQCYDSIGNAVGSIPFAGSINNNSITQGGVCFPSYTDSSKSVICHLAASSTVFLGNNLYYSILGMNVSSGVVEMLEPNINTGPIGLILDEKIIGIQHSNGNDYWLITHVFESDSFAIFLLIDTLVTGPIFQKIGSDYGAWGVGGSSMGQMAASMRGDAIVSVSHNGFIDYFQFSRCTGQLSDHQALAPAIVSTEDNYYGCSISPSGQFLYVSSDALFDPVYVWQYDLWASDIASTRTPIISKPASSFTFGQHLLGPNGKIYISGYEFVAEGWDSLAVINTPDFAGIACGFEENALPLGNGKSAFCLGNFPNYNLGPLQAQQANAGPDYTACPGDTLWIGTGGTKAPEVEIVWTASNGTAWIGDAMAMQTPVTITQTTTFYFTVTDTTLTDCAVTQDSMTVTVVAPQFVPNANAGPDVVRCHSSPDSVQLGSPDFSAGNWSYTWTTSGGTVLDTTAQVTVHPADTTSYLLTVDHQTAVCSASSDTVTVTVELPVTLTPMQGGEVCMAQSGSGVSGTDSVLIGNPGFPWLTYDWTPGDGLRDSTAAQTMAAPNATTLYTLTATDTTLVTACRSASESLTVTVQECESPLALPTSIGPGQTLQIGGLASPVSLTVWDMRGRLIYQSTNYTHDLRAEWLSEAIYGYRVTGADGVTHVRKLVVVW